MPAHRRHADDEDNARARLGRLLGVADTGWTPPQSHADDEAARGVDDPVAPPAWRMTARPSALSWLLVVGLAILVVSGYLLSRHGGSSEPTDPGGPPPAVATLPAPTAASIVVDVGGRVRHPGLVTLVAGARVADAIAAAGGALRPADIATVDLAAHVTDGQLLLIGVPGVPGPPGAAAAGAPVDLNTATVDELDALPGVGPVLAQRIVDWRTAHGGFRTVDDLQQVSGIGASKFDDLKSLVSV